MAPDRILPFLPGSGGRYAWHCMLRFGVILLYDFARRSSKYRLEVLRSFSHLRYSRNGIRYFASVSAVSLRI
jgi:hypothetical protein